MPISIAADAAAGDRRKLLRQIGRERDSAVIAYILSDRQGAQAQVADDAIRPLYDHLRSIGHRTRIDLFLYSTGGLTDVPWRIVTMMREHCEQFGVLVPYRAMSAATMIALGADDIVMGPKGELGPIDPQLAIQRGREGETPVQEQIAVEDLMSYLRLLKDRVGLTDQKALAAPMAALADKLDPWILGQANRAHSHIRDVARKLLMTRSIAGIDESRMSGIIETLAEKTYQHGHAIGRREASALGLNVVRPEPKLEALMWDLLESYEGLCNTRDPLDHEAELGDADQADTRVIMGAIESVARAHLFSTAFDIRRQRQPQPNLTLNLTMNLALPAGVDPGAIPADTQQMLQQMLEQVQTALPEMIQDEVRRQSPPVAIQARSRPAGWRPVDGWT